MAGAEADSGVDPLVGKTLTHFRIAARLGKGGMGVVYRATDLTLGRQVAIKVLPPGVVGDAAHRERFLREARSAAAVTHAHIATVYEIGEVDGTLFIAMELVAGSSLRELVARGALPAPRVLELGRQIADALATAHDAGIVHRDLKPENVMVDPAGERVKILDFGLAKMGPAIASADTIDSGGDASTMRAATAEGVILGTPGYMSPEQAEGRAVDARTDVFAFGVLLHELLSGKGPFARDTPLATLIATSRDDPPALPPGVPEDLAAIVTRCLAKDPAARPASLRGLLPGSAAKSSPSERAGAARDVAFAPTLATPAPLAAPSAPAASAPLAAAPGARTRRGWWLVAAGVVGLLASIRVIKFAATPKSSPRLPGAAAATGDLTERRVTHLPAENSPYRGALSPDGMTLLYLDDRGLTAQAIGGGASTSVPLPDDRPTSEVDISYVPDGQLLVSSTMPTLPGAGLWLGDLKGGWRRILSEVAQVQASPDGRMIAGFQKPAGLFVARVDGGGRRELVPPPGDNDYLVSFVWSPDSQWIAIAHARLVAQKVESSIEVVAVDGARRLQFPPESRLGMPDGAATVLWPDPDSLVYTGGDRGSKLWQQRLTPALLPDGKPVQLFAWDEDHVLLMGFAPRVRRAALLRLQQQIDVYLGTLADAASAGAGLTRFTAHDRDDLCMGFTAEGRVLIDSDRDGDRDAFVQGPDERQPTLIVGGPGVQSPRSTKDAWVIYRLDHSDGGADVATLERVPIAGGPAHQLARYSEAINQLRCVTDEPRCLVLRNQPGEVVIDAVDIVLGTTKEVFREPRFGVGAFDVSRDGKTLALATMQDDRVKLIDLASRVTRDIAVGARYRVIDVTLLADGGLLLCVIVGGDSSALLRWREGRETETLWSSRAGIVISSRVAPDGKRICATIQMSDADIWVLDGL